MHGCRVLLALLTAAAQSDGEPYPPGVWIADEPLHEGQPQNAFPRLSCANMTFGNGCACDTTSFKAAAVDVMDCDPDVDKLEYTDHPFGAAVVTPPVQLGCRLQVETNVEMHLSMFLRFLAKVTFTRQGPLQAGERVQVQYVLSEWGWAPWFNPSNGHFYSTTMSSMAWVDAQTHCAAAVRDYMGLAGYLATVTSAEEQAFLVQGFADNVIKKEKLWIGLSDVALEADWVWLTGPEGCGPYDLDNPPGEQYTRTSCDFNTPLCRAFRRCKDGGKGTKPEDAGLEAWAKGQPSTGMIGNENFAAISSDSGKWSDERYSTQFPFLCEWGGVGTLDTCLPITNLVGRSQFTAHVDECDVGTLPCGDDRHQSCLDTFMTTLGDYSCTCGGNTAVGRPATCPTSAPSTPAPNTPTPQTNQPPTPAPVTSIPPTSAPPSPAPSSPAPSTPVPPSPAPPTPRPPTPAPFTPAPPTPAPSSPAPAWPAATPAPPTPTPTTLISSTPAPRPSVEQTPSPLLFVAVDECNNAGACDKDQACVDPTTALFDWVCTCRDGVTAVGRPAVCKPTHAPAPPPRTPAPPSPSPSPATPDAASTTTTTGSTPVQRFSPRTEAPTPWGRGLGEEATEMLRDTGPASTAASIISGGQSAVSAGNAGKLALIRNFGCEVDDVDLGFDEPLDFEFHPTGVALGRGRARYLVGAVVMNLTLLIAFLGLCVGGAVLLATVTDRTFEQSLAVLKSPGLLLVPYMFLLPGTCLASARLLFSPGVSGGGWAAAGGAVLLLVCATPVVLYWYVIRRIPSGAHLSPDPRLFRAGGGMRSEAPGTYLTGTKRGVYEFAFGEHIWVSSAEGSYFCDTTGLVFDSYKEGRAWVLLAEIGLNILLSFMSAWKPADSTQCHVRNGIISVAFLAFFGAVAWMKPFLAALDNAVATALAGMTAFALVAITIGIAGELESDGVVFGISAWCLLLSALLVMAKGVYDLMVYAIDLCLDRRQGARDAARRQEEVHGMIAMPLARVRDRDQDIVSCDFTPALTRVQNAGSSRPGTPLPPHDSQSLLMPDLSWSRARMSSSELTVQPLLGELLMPDLSWSSARMSSSELTVQPLLGESPLQSSMAVILDQKNPLVAPPAQRQRARTSTAAPVRPVRRISSDGDFSPRSASQSTDISARRLSPSGRNPFSLIDGTGRVAFRNTRSNARGSVPAKSTARPALPMVRRVDTLQLKN